MSTSAFSRFPGRLQEAIVSRLGWTALRPVQEMATQAILNGANAVVLAPTAGGKTEASVFPVIATLMTAPSDGVGAVYIAPIKALLNNQEERLGLYTEMVGLRRAVWHGDTRDADKSAFLREPAELLMTTPESLEVMLLSQRVPAAALFRDLKAVIIDEIHAFAGTDRGAHLMSVLERISSISGRDFQRIGLSATVGNPERILFWLAGSSRRPGLFVDPPRQPRRREILISLLSTLDGIAKEAAVRAYGRKSLFFCQSRAMAEAVADRLRGRAIDVFVHHSSVALTERQAAEERFQRGSNASIVCTSTLELGIDVGDLDIVLQANAPGSVSSFLQRMGRTGRRDGQAANTTFLCETADAVLQAAAIVELARESWIEPVDTGERCWPVLAHQVLAMTLQHGAISAERIWTLLSLVPDFAGIRRPEYNELIDFMTQRAYVFETGGLLSFGKRAEREFGRRNFMELYAVFSTPVLYRVRTASGRDLGSLEQAFVDRLAEGMSAFLLTGKAWVVETVQHAEKLVTVKPAPKGQKPTWGGFLPQFLGFELCQCMRRILCEVAPLPYLDPAAQAALADQRERLGDPLRRNRLPIQISDETAVVWTFAGGVINWTLRSALHSCLGLAVSADNTALRLSLKGSSLDGLHTALTEMADQAWWERAENQERLSITLPAYRFSKFQNLLPSHIANEFIREHLMDTTAAAQFLADRIGNCPAPQGS